MKVFGTTHICGSTHWICAENENSFVANNGNEFVVNNGNDFVANNKTAECVQ